MKNKTKIQLVENSEKLLPCPHCGSTNLKPQLNEYIGDIWLPSWWVECDNCPCGMEVQGETPEQLILAWNRRFNVNQN